MVEQETGIKDFIKYCSNKIDKAQIESYSLQLKRLNDVQIEMFKSQLLQELSNGNLQMFAHCYANVIFICSKYLSSISIEKIDSLWSLIVEKLLHEFVNHIQKFPDGNDKKHTLHINKVLDTWKSKKLFNSATLSLWEKLLLDEMPRIEKVESEIQSARKNRKRSFADTLEPLPHTDTSPSDIMNDLSPPYPPLSESSISQSLRQDLIHTIYSFIYKLFEPLGRVAGQGGGGEQIYWKILTISAFWLLHNYEENILLSDDAAAIGFACVYLAGKAEHYFIKTDKLRSMAQRVVKECFGSEDLPKDKDIFHYELKLLQCIEFNINHIQNPIPLLRTWELDKLIDHSMFLRVLEQLYQYPVLCERNIWSFTKEIIALVFLLVQVGCRMDSGRVLRDRLKVVLAPKKIIDLLRAEAVAFASLLKIVQDITLLPLVNPATFYETVNDLYHRIINHMNLQSAAAAELDSKPISETTAIDNNKTVSVESNQLSPLITASWTPEVSTPHENTGQDNITVDDRESERQQAIDQLLATCSTPEQLQEDEHLAASTIPPLERRQSTSPELRQATREDSFVEDLVEDKAVLDEAIEIAVVKASLDQEEEEENSKNVELRNEHATKNGPESPLTEVISPPLPLPNPIVLPPVTELKSILPLQRQSSNPKKHVHIEESHTITSIIPDHTQPDPYPYDSSTSQQPCTADPYAYRNVAPSPAVSIGTLTTSSFSPSYLNGLGGEDCSNNTPVISRASSIGRWSRASSINMNDLSLFDPADLGGDASEQPLEEEFRQPVTSSGVNSAGQEESKPKVQLSRQNAISEVSTQQETTYTETNNQPRVEEIKGTAAKESDKAAPQAVDSTSNEKIAKVTAVKKVVSIQQPTTPSSGGKKKEQSDLISLSGQKRLRVFTEVIRHLAPSSVGTRTPTTNSSYSASVTSTDDVVDPSPTPTPAEKTTNDKSTEGENSGAKKTLPPLSERLSRRLSSSSQDAQHPPSAARTVIVPSKEQLKEGENDEDIDEEDRHKSKRKSFDTNHPQSNQQKQQPQHPSQQPQRQQQQGFVRQNSNNGPNNNHNYHHHQQQQQQYKDHQYHDSSRQYHHNNNHHNHRNHHQQQSGYYEEDDNDYGGGRRVSIATSTNHQNNNHTQRSNHQNQHHNNRQSYPPNGNGRDNHNNYQYQNDQPSKKARSIKYS